VVKFSNYIEDIHFHTSARIELISYRLSGERRDYYTTEAGQKKNPFLFLANRPSRIGLEKHN
jgi:hypothetical protein